VYITKTISIKGGNILVQWFSTGAISPPLMSNVGVLRGNEFILAVGGR